MFTDIVGYTALTERDEEQAIHVRGRHRRLVGALVEQFEGELVDATGDETFATFPSALLAVDCALAIQAALRDDQSLRLRIGIHLGDVLRQDGEVLGEGVNLASRLCPLAQPAGICVSEQVYHVVRTRPHVVATSLGARELKNVAVPVEAFELGPQAVSVHSRSRTALKVVAGIATTAVMAYAAYLPNRAAILSAIVLTAPHFMGNPIEQEVGFATASDGVQIAYATTGEGPPVVFVLGWVTHLEEGLGSPLYDGDGPIRALSEKHLFVRYDGRGFGLSQRDVDDFSLDARVRDLEAVVDALGLERFALWAISAGGPAAIAYAVKHPERVSRIVFQSTFAGPPELSPEDSERWQAMLTLFRTSWDSPMIRSMMVSFLGGDEDEVGARVLSEFLLRSGDGPAIAGFIGTSADARELAPRLRVPSLVIHGTEDTTVPIEAGRDLAVRVPDARFQMIDGYGHIGPPEKAREALDHVVAFLSEEPGA